MALALSNVTFGVLAGGLGRRVEKADKGLLSYKEQLLCQHVINAVTVNKRPAKILISANRNIAKYQQIADVVTDTRAGYQGPMAGIEALLSAAKTDWLMICACDMLNPPNDLFDKMLQAGSKTGVKIAIAEDQQRLHYTCSIIHTDVLPSVSAYLDSGKRSIKGWLNVFANSERVTVTFDGKLINANTPEDLI